MQTLSRQSQFVALIPAAGVGARMGGGMPKQYLNLAGRTVLQRTVDCFLACDAISQVFVVVSESDAYIDNTLLPHDKLKVARCGGASRRDTVMNGLSAMQNVADMDWVLVHDAARPGLSLDLLEKMITELGMDQVGGILALPIVDTIKRMTNNRLETVSRDGMWAAQTPQMFRRGLLIEALSKCEQVTDESSAIEALGLMPKLVLGDSHNRKLTVPEDLQFFENIFRLEA